MCYHEGLWEVWWVGNLMALDRDRNRTGSDRWPSAKLPLYRSKGGWPEDFFLSPSEEMDLLDAEKLLIDEKLPEAMERFISYSRTRGLRIFSAVAEKFQEIWWFARGQPLPDDEETSGSIAQEATA